jgi:hypothetical protein
MEWLYSRSIEYILSHWNYARFSTSGGTVTVKREEDQASVIGAESEEEGGGEEGDDGSGEGEEGSTEDVRTEDEAEFYESDSTERDSRIGDPDWTP